MTLTGQNFASGATVTFGGVAATSVVVVNATQITANTPAHAQGSVSVVVANPDGQSATRTGGFTFNATAPVLIGVAPRTGLTTGGTSVTLTGQYFAPGATVTFGGAAATSVVVVSATQITAKTPPHAQGSVNVVVTNPDRQSATLLTALLLARRTDPEERLAQNWTYRGRYARDVDGMNFGSGATVTFGGTAATSVVVISTTMITAKTPPHKPGGVDITVSTADGQRSTLSKAFTYHKH